MSIHFQKLDKFPVVLVTVTTRRGGEETWRLYCFLVPFIWRWLLRKQFA